MTKTVRKTAAGGTITEYFDREGRRIKLVHQAPNRESKAVDKDDI